MTDRQRFARLRACQIDSMPEPSPEPVEPLGCIPGVKPVNVALLNGHTAEVTMFHGDSACTVTQGDRWLTVTQHFESRKQASEYFAGIISRLAEPVGVAP